MIRTVRMMTTCLTLLILMVWCVPALADEMKVFQLENRTAEELVPILSAVVSEQVRLSGTGDQLVVRGPDDEIAMISKALTDLDRLPEQLRITVRQSRRTSGAGKSWSSSGSIDGKRGSVSIGTQSGAGGNSLSTGGSHRIGNVEKAQEQSIQVLDGERGYVMVGRDEPFTTGMRAFAGNVFNYGSVDVEYRKVGTGFWVLPKLQGDQVRLELTPQMEGLDSAAARKTVEFQQFTTVSRVPLGVWTNISGSVADSSQAGRAILSYKAGQKDELRELWVLVDKL